MFKTLFLLSIFSLIPTLVVSDNIPEGHAFTDISTGMEESEVRSILGKPARVTRYNTGKAWIPGAGRWMNDTRRHSWFYKGKGSIVFSKNRYSGLYLVKKINYDPNQR